MQFFAETSSFINEGRMRGGCLVHCYAGVSRSATAIIAFLIDTLGLDATAAFEVVKRARPQANPNAGFLQQLKRYEAMNAMKRGRSSHADALSGYNSGSAHGAPADFGNGAVEARRGALASASSSLSAGVPHFNARFSIDQMGIGVGGVSAPAYTRVGAGGCVSHDVSRGGRSGLGANVWTTPVMTPRGPDAWPLRGVPLIASPPPPSPFPRFVYEGRNGRLEGGLEQASGRMLRRGGEQPARRAKEEILPQQTASRGLRRSDSTQGQSARSPQHSSTFYSYCLPPSRRYTTGFAL
jgi:hypothetical protein